MKKELTSAVEKLKNLGVEKLDGVISTGSGQVLDFDDLEIILELPYSEIDGMGGESIYGHVGVLKILRIKSGDFWAIFTGRRHFYQGCNYNQIGFYLDLSHTLGASTFICLNAAGGLDPSLKVGELVIAKNFKCFIPIPGVDIPIDGTSWQKTDSDLVENLNKAASELGMTMKSSNYVGVPGPTYETAADVKWLRNLGATVVGMSTVPELYRGKGLGMKVTSISVVANVHGSGDELTHEEVVNSSKRANADLVGILSSYFSM